MKPLLIFKSSVCIFLIAFSFTNPLISQVFVEADKIIKEGSSSITYTMAHPLHTWSGITKNVNGFLIIKKNKIVKAAVAFNVVSLNSNNTGRDKKMLNYIDAFKYATISFVTNNIVQEEKQLQVQGTFYCNGRSATKKLTIPYTKMDNSIQCIGSFELQLSDFNIQPPAFMFTKTKNTFTIAYNLVFASKETM